MLEISVAILVALRYVTNRFDTDVAAHGFTGDPSMERMSGGLFGRPSARFFALPAFGPGMSSYCFSLWPIEWPAWLGGACSIKELSP